MTSSNTMDTLPYERELEDGRVVSVIFMMYSYRLCVGDGLRYDDGWCYPHDLGQAFVIACAEEWDGEGDPADGWIKQLSTGRRRYGGDPAREYVDR